MELQKLYTQITLEMTGDTNRYLVSAKQGDKATRYIQAKLLNAGKEYQIPAGARAVFNVTKPDKTHVYNACTYEGSIVTVELTNQTLAAAGTAYCEVEIRTGDNEQIITSANFTMEIEPSQRHEHAIVSSDEYTELEKRFGEVIDRVGLETDEALEYMKHAASAAATNASQAGKSATQASGSATAAAGSASAAKKSETAAASSASSASSSASIASTKATESGTKASEASSSAKLSRSYAIGDTNSRTGEATDSAKYYKEQAASSANAASTQASTAASQATTATQKASAAATSASQASGSAAAAAGSAAQAAESAKQAKAAVGTIPSAESIAKLQTDKLDKAGDAKDTTVSFAEAASLVNVNTGEKSSVLWGKVKKAISTLISHISTMASATVAGHVKFGSVAGTACQGNDERLSNARTPTAHAHAAGSTYGIGTNTVYGHVKLSDAYATNNGAASSGIGASQNALYSAYVNLNEKNNAVNTRVTSLEAGREDYKQWIPTFGTTTRLIPNALYVDINTANGDMNKVGYVVAGNTTNMPSGCYYGIREAYFFNTTNVWVKIMGVNSNGDYAEWVNVYNGTIWRGWSVTSMSYI